MSAFIDIAGERFGRLTATKVVDRVFVPTGTILIWECVCDCGKIVRARRTSLGRGVNSCGCLKYDTTRSTGKRNKGRGLPHGVGARNKLLDKYKRQAGFRKLAFELSTEQFDSLTKGKCRYCGVPPYQILTDKGFNGYYAYNGIDRVDNSKGYVFDNCVSCCGNCNKAKLAMSETDFASWIKNVYWNFASKFVVE